MTFFPGTSAPQRSRLIRFDGIGMMPHAELLADNRISTASALLCQADRHHRPDGPSGRTSPPGIADDLAVGKKKRLNLLLRLAGIALLCAAASAGYLCTQLVRSGGHHPATAVELLLSLAMFVCTSGGLLLLTMGIHLFDEVEIAERWRPRR